MYANNNNVLWMLKMLVEKLDYVLIDVTCWFCSYYTCCLRMVMKSSVMVYWWWRSVLLLFFRNFSDAELARGGWWRLAIGGWWWLAIGDWWQRAIGGWWWRQGGSQWVRRVGVKSLSEVWRMYLRDTWAPKLPRCLAVGGVPKWSAVLLCNRQPAVLNHSQS